MRPALILASILSLAAPGGASSTAAPVGLPVAAEPAAGDGAAVRHQSPGAESQPAMQPPEIRLRLAEDGRIVATGLLPQGVGDAFAATLPEADATRLRQGGADSGGWERALTALSIVLPRFRTVEARVYDGRLAIRGALQPGLSTEGTRAALRSALERGWFLDLDIAESDPPAGIHVRKSDGRTTVSGLLPRGLDLEGRTALLGEDVVLRGLAGGGGGDSRSWERVLGALSQALDLFFTAEGAIVEGRIQLSGVLRPGYSPDGLAGLLRTGLPDRWRVDLDAAVTPPSEGDRRVSLESGEAETFRRGFWLPDLDFPVSPMRCDAETGAALASGGIRFLGRTAEIDPVSRPLVDRLAAIAVRCLNSSRLRLEVAGHTDSVGNDGENQALSDAKAQAVRRALVERGVRPESVTVTGYGESAPIATNDTVEGRALNRRIEFRWSGGADGGL